jgi:Pyruvate/2-oxoacid:ferredoxin oxidoreductase delta subunit
MPAPSLSTPAARIEARDAATFAWHAEHENLLAQEDSPREADTLSAAATALSDLGYLVAPQLYFDDGYRVCPTLTVTACDGSTITLEWDAMIDGFDYPTSGDDGCDLDEIEANTEDEPDQFDAAEPPANSAAWCDGCEQFCPIDDVEISAEGDETFAYCKGCRAKDANAPRDCY